MIFVIQLWRSGEYWVFKILGTLIGAIPVLGPLLLFFVFDRTPPQSRRLQNREPRGWYTNGWIQEREFWKKRIEEKEAKTEESEPNPNP